MPTDSSGKKWGLWDTEGQCWLGTAEGPTVFTEDNMYARAAATLAGERLGGTGRVRVKPFEEARVEVKDTVTPLLSGEEAVRRVEARLPLQPAPGTFEGLTQPEIALIENAIRDKQGDAVEIGCLDGWSTAHILRCCQMRLTTIDPFVPDSMEATLVGSEERFWANVAPWRERVTLLKKYSQDVADGWSLPLDFLFIDGDHQYGAVLRDYWDWTPFLKVGGVLAMHDSRMYRIDPARAKFHPGPSQVAEDQVFGKPDKWQILGEVWALTVACKRA